MNHLRYVAAALAILASSGEAQECVPNPAAPALDHVVLVTSNLDSAGSRFREHGFRLKQGRLHANNLLNRHIKFRDGTSLELMTVAGEPRDVMAREYAQLTEAGSGGVYVALKVPSVSRPQNVAGSLRLEPQASSSGPWQFIGFPQLSQAAAVFFSSGAAVVQDPDSLIAHQPGVTGLAEAWLEGGPELIALLERLGANRCGRARSPEGRAGDRLVLSRGAVVIVPMRAESRPRVLGAVLSLIGPDTGGAVIRPMPSFWVSYTHVVY